MFKFTVNQEIAGVANEVKELMGKGQWDEAKAKWASFVTYCSLNAREISKMSVGDLLKSCSFEVNMVSSIGSTTYVNGLPIAVSSIRGVENTTFIVDKVDIDTINWLDANPIAQPPSVRLFKTMSGNVKHVNLPKGLVVAPAKAKAGKSFLMTAIAEEVDSSVVHWGEPDASSLPSGASIMWAALTIASNQSDTIVLDSWKDLLNLFTDNLGSGGVSRNIGSYISSTANTFARRGMSLVVAINPGTTNDKALDDLSEMFVGAASGIIEPIDIIEVEGTWVTHQLSIYSRYDDDRDTSDVQVRYNLKDFLNESNTSSKNSFSDVDYFSDDIAALRAAGRAFMNSSDDNGAVLGQGLTIKRPQANEPVNKAVVTDKVRSAAQIKREQSQFNNSILTDNKL